MMSFVMEEHQLKFIPPIYPGVPTSKFDQYMLKSDRSRNTKKIRVVELSQVVSSCALCPFFEVAKLHG